MNAAGRDRASAAPPARVHGITSTDILGAFIVTFAAWTLAANGVVIAGGSLYKLMIAGPLASMAALAAFLAYRRRAPLSPYDDTAPVRTTPSAVTPTRWLIAAAATTATLTLSWHLFWVCAVVFLACSAWSARREQTEGPCGPHSPRGAAAWLVFLCVANAVLALATNRPDQDDGFYVAVSAFASSHPTEPLLAFDPMLVERSWPLIFPSYRFASYELLVATIAHATALPAIVVAHVVLPPIAASLAVISVYVLVKEWRTVAPVALVAVALAFTIVFGESGRSPANFGFVRSFQGKAILLWTLVPAIYAFTLRHVRRSTGHGDLVLLGGTYVAAIGMSNFGMLIAPIAGLTAAAAACAAGGSAFRRGLQAGACAIIPLPWLAWVALTSHSGSTFAAEHLESAADAWTTSFGPTSQFLIAFLLLAAPIVARGRVNRLALSIPTLLMLGVGLNPALAPFLGRYVTTPPVYWRVTWQVPVLIYAAFGLHGLVRMALARNSDAAGRPAALAAAGLSLVGVAYLTQFNTLRPANSVSWAFAQPKVEPQDAHIADRAIERYLGHGRILAPDRISSVISMHENHPPLAFARGMYIYLIRDAIPPADYSERMRLAEWMNTPSAPLADDIPKILDTLGITLIATGTQDPASAAALKKAGFSLVDRVASDEVWRRD